MCYLVVVGGSREEMPVRTGARNARIGPLRALTFTLTNEEMGRDSK